MSLTEDYFELADQRHEDEKAGGCYTCGDQDNSYGLEVSPGIWKYYCWPCYKIALAIDNSYLNCDCDATDLAGLFSDEIAS